LLKLSFAVGIESMREKAERSEPNHSAHVLPCRSSPASHA